MFEKGINQSFIFCLTNVKDISTDMSEDQVLEERDLDLNKE